MRTSQSFRIYFTIRSDKARDGKAPIYAAVTINKEKSFIALKETVNVSVWDLGRGVAKGTRDEAKVVNAYLDDVRLSLGNCYKELLLSGKLITSKAIKNMFLGESDQTHTLVKLINYHNETAGRSLNPATLKHYEVTQRYLLKFLRAQYKAEDILLRDIDYSFVQAFDTFLRNFKPIDHHQPISNNGVKVHLIRLKKMVNLAENLEWMDRNPFSTYKIKMKKVAREYLTEAELLSVEQKDFTLDSLQLIRDLFIFSCYTGLAYVDLIRLKPVQIVTAFDGVMWIRTAREKTQETVNLPILPKAYDILKKYEHNARALYHQTVFPVISNQKINSYLKEIAKLCHVHKNLTFHMARHTFATTVTLSNGVPLETVSKILGHSRVSTTQVYARVVEKKLQADMQQLQEKLACKSDRKHIEAKGK